MGRMRFSLEQIIRNLRQVEVLSAHFRNVTIFVTI